MPLPREEQETVIRLGFYDEFCTVTTSNPTHARRLEMAGLKAEVSRIPTKWDEKEDKKGKLIRTPTEYEDTTWSFQAPAEWFKLPRPKKQVSEAQREASRERMRALHAKDDDDE